MISGDHTGGDDTESPPAIGFAPENAAPVWGGMLEKHLYFWGRGAASKTQSGGI